MRTAVWAGVVLAMLAAPAVAQAQGIPGGAEHGFHEGNRIAGPVGAVVGTAVGGVIGGVEGVLGIGPRPVVYPGYVDAPPPRAYRHHHRITHVRTTRHAARVRRAPAAQPGYVN